MNIKVLFDAKRKRHYVARIVGLNVLEEDTEQDYAKALNALLLPKSPARFIEAIDVMPPLYPSREDEKKNYYLPDEAIRVFPERFVGFDEDLLAAEIFLESARSLRVSQRTIRGISKKYAVTGSDCVEPLSLYDENKCVVLLEPLQDWFMLRNSLSLCANLLGQINDKRRNVNLEDAGFRFVHIRPGDDGAYVLPFCHNDFHDRSLLESSDRRPLLCSVVGATSPQETSYIPLEKPASLLDNVQADIFFISSSRAGNTDLQQLKQAFRLEGGARENQILYLCVEGKENPEKLAESLVASFTTAFRRLGKKDALGGNTLGWFYDAAGEFENLNSPRIIARSFPSALYYELLYHPGKRITVCKNCGNAVLSRKQGTRKEYCSDSCRVTAVIKRKQASETERG